MHEQDFQEERNVLELKKRPHWLEPSEEEKWDPGEAGESRAGA